MKWESEADAVGAAADAIQLPLWGSDEDAAPLDEEGRRRVVGVP